MSDTMSRRAFIRSLVGAALAPVIAKLAPVPVLDLTVTKTPAVGCSLALLGSAGEVVRVVPYASIPRLRVALGVTYERLAEDYASVEYSAVRGEAP